jgi:hypothetical protein
MQLDVLCPKTVDLVVGLDAQPALRNRLITQCYHDLSSILAGALGGPDVNWCTYATWASATAGTFIRDEEVPRLLRELLGGSVGVRGTLASLGTRLVGPAGERVLSSFDLLSAAANIVGDVRSQITLGNRAVFAELAPIFGAFIRSLDGGRPNAAKLDALLASLRPGPSTANGQSLLREAFEELGRAACEHDPRRRAEHMLLANALTGLHEQLRLQPFIAGSLDAPVDDLLREHWLKGAPTAEGAGNEGLWSKVHTAWERFGSVLAHHVSEAWEQFATHTMMTLTVPGQVLHLGQALPPPPDAPLYPAELLRIQNPDLYELLIQYDATDPDALGDVGASDWSALPQRMRYILALFRSRQQTPSLRGQPFSDETQQTLWRDLKSSVEPAG